MRHFVAMNLNFQANGLSSIFGLVMHASLSRIIPL